MGVVAGGGCSLAFAAIHAAVGIHRGGHQVNREQIIKFCAAAERFADELVAVAARIELTTVLRQAAFLAQVAHESNGFHSIVENLNYSRGALLQLFGKHFDEQAATEYQRQPERIANRLYANRMGNGPEASGDGWRFRGRGLIQVTGKDNYSRCSFFLFGDARLTLNPELLEQPRFACDSAGWFWQQNKLNRFADAEDLEGLTRAINGGLTGLMDRQRWMREAKAALAA